MFCLSKSRQDITEFLENHGEISEILVRSRQSRRDVENLSAILTRFEKPLKSLQSRKRSAKIQKLRNIMAKTRQSRRKLGNHGEISAGLVRSPSLGKIAARFPPSRRDLAEIQKLTKIMVRFKRGLGKNFAGVYPNITYVPNGKKEHRHARRERLIFYVNKKNPRGSQ